MHVSVGEGQTGVLHSGSWSHPGSLRLGATLLPERPQNRTEEVSTHSFKIRALFNNTFSLKLL